MKAIVKKYWWLLLPIPAILIYFTWTYHNQTDKSAGFFTYLKQKITGTAAET